MYTPHNFFLAMPLQQDHGASIREAEMGFFSPWTDCPNFSNYGFLAVEL